MRREALADTPPELRIEYVDSAAEELPFGDGDVTAVLAAQSLQWFDRPRFLAEAARVLRPGGTLAVAQNNRCWQESPLLEAYEEFLEAHSPGYSRLYRAFDVEAEIAAAEAFAPAPTARERWTLTLTLEEFLGLARSSTKMQAAMRALGEERALELLLEAVRPHLDGREEVVVPYVAELYLARRA
jgi:ubiquinone/menaquinone biosynthesis C-methylase UbiE